MTNEEAKILLVSLFAEWYKVTYEANENKEYKEAVAVAISALERMDLKGEQP